MTPEKLLEKAERAKYLYESAEELNAIDRMLMQKWVEAANPAYVEKLCRAVIIAKKAIECRNGSRNAGEYSRVLDELEKALAALEEQG